MDNEKMTVCETCGGEIAASAKTCPHCGAKHKVKKPVYKRPWFWILIVGFVILMLPDTSTKTQEPEKPAQSVAEQTQAPVQSAESSEPGKEESALPAWTTAQKNVMAKAKAYLGYTAFSYSGLIEQLEYEKFTHEEAVWAADNCNADWNEQAVFMAKAYLDYTSFSYSGLIEQLEYAGFTAEQATHGADSCGADWNEQAAIKAESYLDYSAFSRQGLIDQLLYEGFTQEQAEYGVSQNGY